MHAAAAAAASAAPAARPRGAAPEARGDPAPQRRVAVAVARDRRAEHDVRREAEHRWTPKTAIVTHTHAR